MSSDKLAQALRYYRDECSGAEPSLSVFHKMLDEALAAHEAEKQAGPVALGYMNAGHLHEMQQGRLPYGYVYAEEGPGAHVPIYLAPPSPLAEQAGPVAIQAPDDSDLLTIAYLSGAHDAKRQLNLNDRAVQKRLAAQWGYVQAPAVAHDVPTSPLTEQDKEDAESALQWLYEEGCDLRSEARSDDDYGYVVVEHYMAKPHERVIGRGDKPLDAIRAARAKKEQP